MKLLEGKTVVVSGAARGIGRSIALKLGSEGANVAFTVREKNDNSDSLEKEIISKGVKAKAYVADAADYNATIQAVDEIMKDFGRIDAIVNNAGITKDGLLMRMSEKQWDDVIRINLKSAFNLTKAVTPIMMRQRSGSIINITSVVGVSGNAGQSNYAASKAGMIGFTKSIALELGSRNIRTNAVAPGFILTDMTNDLSEEVKEEWFKSIPLKRGGEPEEVANTVLFLASDLSSYVNGQVINVCGGMTT